MVTTALSSCGSFSVKKSVLSWDSHHKSALCKWRGDGTVGVSVNEEMLPQGLELAGAALCQLPCVATLQINASDRVCVKNILIFILKSSRNSLFSCCLRGAEGKQASMPVPWGVLLHLPHAHSPLSYVSVSAGSGLTALHFASSATNADISLPFWLLKMCYLSTSRRSVFINIHSVIYTGQPVWFLSDLAKNIWQKNCLLSSAKICTQ